MNELTNEQQAMSQLYSVLCAVVQSEHTPKHTAEAIISTLEKLFNDKNIKKLCLFSYRIWGRKSKKN